MAAGAVDSEDDRLGELSRELRERFRDGGRWERVMFWEG
jgi:hypothetical protein